MFDAKATDNSIDKSDDKNDEENDVVQNICSGLRFRVIDVHPTDDEEEEANDHLILNVFGIIIMLCHCVQVSERPSGKRATSCRHIVCTVSRSSLAWAW